jgi:hypothetical protein
MQADAGRRGGVRSRAAEKDRAGGPVVSPGTARSACLLSAACGLALLLGPPIARAALPPAATQDLWIEARSARFHVYSNADASVAARAARHLERLAEVLRLGTNRLLVDGGRETHVYVFRDLASFKPYRPYGDDDEGGVTAGFHASGVDVEYIAFYASEHEWSMRFASHEYLHAVLARSLGALPVWVNEGIAEYYSTFETRRRSAEIGRPIPEHLAWLLEHMFTLRGLLLIAMDSPEYQQGKNTRTVYAQSWALVHLLAMDPVTPSRFGLLLAGLGRGMTSLDAVQAAYGTNAPDSLERRLREYVKQDVLLRRVLEFSDDFDQVPVAIRALDRVETHTVLGELLAHTRDELAPLAREHLEAAWRKDSTRTLPAALLGEMAERQKDRADASRWFAAVQRSGGREPRALGIAGAALAQRRLHSSEPLRWPASGASTDALQARSMLARALEDRSEATEWLTPYAMTFLDDSADVQEGIGALLRAQEDWPRRTDIKGALSVLNLRAGNRGAALAMYDRIPPGDDRAVWRANAGNLIRHQTMIEAGRLVREDRPVEAESLVVRLRRIVKEPGVAASCDEELAWIRAARVSSSPEGSRTSSTKERGPAATAGRPAPVLSRAGRDSLAADARNEKRLRAADALVRNGSPALACALYDLILGDRPRVSLRREIERRKARYCAGAGRP